LDEKPVEQSDDNSVVWSVEQTAE
jgi:hypothetical protein